MLELIHLQQYWWIIISLLASLLVFLFFVQGGQALMYTLGKTPTELTMIINTLGRKWEFTFTTLVTFGGAFFASFPLFYATSFGGAYWVWIAILFVFVIQAVSFEYRTKVGNLLGQKTYQAFLIINGCLAPFLVGVAVGTLFNGASFSIDDMNYTTWHGAAWGLEAVLNINNVALGLAIALLAVILGAMYIISTVDNDAIRQRGVNVVKKCTLVFLLTFIFFVVKTLLGYGYAYNPETGEVFLEAGKYLNNFLQMPIVLIIFLVGVILVITGIAMTIFKKGYTRGIWFSGLGTIFTVLALFLILGLNNTCYYPSLYNMQDSINIVNSSSSEYTLTVMSYVSILIPFVLGYIVYAWYAMTNKPITEKEIDDDEHAY